jgi:RimJ/RimL family protein N-acetyltransferase
MASSMTTLLIRDVTQADLPTFFEHQKDPEAARMAAFQPRARDAFMAHWTRILADSGSAVKTIVFEGQVAGNVVSWTSSGERLVGYWVGKEFWGKGVATAALAQFLVVYPERPLHAHVAKDNVGSVRVLQKCGFVVIGEEQVPGDVAEFVMRLG